MKHPFFSLLSASLLLGSLAVGTVVSAIPAAADGTSGDYTYEVDEETLKGYITGYTGKDKEITIPEELDGTVIAGISADTFYNCDTLEKITIPASITEIGESAFYDCDNLKEFAVADDSETYYAKDGVLFRTKDDCLMAYPPAATATATPYRTAARNSIMLHSASATTSKKSPCRTACSILTTGYLPMTTSTTSPFQIAW